MPHTCLYFSDCVLTPGSNSVHTFLLYFSDSIVNSKDRAPCKTFLYFFDSFLTPGPSSLRLFFSLFPNTKGDHKIHKLKHDFFFLGFFQDGCSCVPWLSLFDMYASCNWELGGPPIEYLICSHSFAQGFVILRKFFVCQDLGPFIFDPFFFSFFFLCC